MKVLNFVLIYGYITHPKKLFDLNTCLFAQYIYVFVAKLSHRSIFIIYLINIDLEPSDGDIFWTLLNILVILGANERPWGIL